MINISRDDIDGLLDFASLVEYLQTAHQRDTEVIDDRLLQQPGCNDVTDSMLIRTAWQRGRYIGIKMASIFPGNTELPSIHAAYMLFDGRNGQALAVLDGTAMTYWKTAADSALGSKLLSRRQSRCLLMVGAGAMAPYLIRAHRAVRPSLENVLVWNRSPDRAAGLVNRLQSSLPAKDPLKIAVSEDLPEAANSADIISCATMSQEPLIHGEWLRPGCHLDLVGAFTPSMREADDRCLQRGSLFVDSRKTTIGEIGELIIPISTGVITENDILADLYDLCRQRHPGRQADEEITVFKNGGGGHLDLMTACRILEQSRP